MCINFSSPLSHLSDLYYNTTYYKKYVDTLVYNYLLLYAFYVENLNGKTHTLPKYI